MLGIGSWVSAIVFGCLELSLGVCCRLWVSGIIFWVSGIVFWVSGIVFGSLELNFGCLDLQWEK